MSRGTRLPHQDSIPAPLPLRTHPLRAVPFMRLILVVCTLATFGRTATYGFAAWDDDWWVSKNPDFSPPTFAHLLQIWTHSFGSLYVPVTRSLWWLIAQMAYSPAAHDGGNLQPWAFHGANIVLHMLSTLVVFELALQLIGKDWPACAAALLFALHPVQAESVAWIVGMRDVLGGLLGLVALWQYVRYAQLVSSSDVPLNGAARRRARMHYLLATSAFIAGMLSKPSDATLPLMAAALDFWILRRPARRVARSLAPWLLLALPVLIATPLIQTTEGIPVTPLWSRPLIAGDALAFYLGKVVRPVELAVDYGRRPAVVLQQQWAYFAWMIPIALLGIGWFLRRRWPWVITCVVLFITALLSTLGWTPFIFQYFSTVADHYLYLAMIGPALAMGWAVAVLSERVRLDYLAGGCAALFVVLGVCSALDVGYWQDAPTFWEHALAVNPHSFTARTQVAMELEKLGQMEAAREQLKAALQDNPDFPEGLNDLIILDAQFLGHWDEARRVGANFLEASAKIPKRAQVGYLATYAMLAQAEMRFGRPERAMPYYSLLYNLDPGNLAVVRAMEEAQRQMTTRPATTQPA